MPMRDKVAIGSGASRGIGRRIALTLASNGAAAIAKVGHIDVLVSHAGINMRSPTRRVLDINLNGTLSSRMAVLLLMLEWRCGRTEALCVRGSGPTARGCHD
jgi:NAD(P)-dependent dehydrogenase (short-subunit alcohol dehydrogenase family)